VLHGLIRSDLRLKLLPVEPDEGSLVAHLVAVVGSAEHSEHLPSFLVLITFLLNLVAPHHQLYPYLGSNLTQVVVIDESLSDVRAELNSDPSLGRVAPFLVTRIAPEALAHDSLIAWFSLPVLLPYIL